MKKNRVFALTFIVIIGIVIGFIVSSNASTNTKSFTCEDVINQFKSNNLPLGKIVYITESNDPNNLLNRPKGYIGKVVFEVTGVEQNELEDLPEGGTLEIFETKELAKKRHDYIDSFEGMLAVKQWMYLKGNMLLRIDYEAKKSDADKFKEVFENIK